MDYVKFISLHPQRRELFGHFWRCQYKTLNSLKEDVFQIAFFLLWRQTCHAQLVLTRALNYFGCTVTILITSFKVLLIMKIAMSVLYLPIKLLQSFFVITLGCTAINYIKSFSQKCLQKWKDCFLSDSERVGIIRHFLRFYWCNISVARIVIILFSL